jgi:hypothetical protein
VDWLNRRAVYVMWLLIPTVALALAAPALALIPLTGLVALLVRFAVVRRAVVTSIGADSLTLAWRGRKTVLPTTDMAGASRVYPAPGFGAYQFWTRDRVSPLWRIDTKHGFWPWRRGYLAIADGGDEKLTAFLQARHLIRWN